MVIRGLDQGGMELLIEWDSNDVRLLEIQVSSNKNKDVCSSKKFVQVSGIKVLFLLAAEFKFVVRVEFAKS